MRLSELLGGVSTYVCAKHGIRGHALPGNVDFGPFIRRNLVESGTVIAQT